MRMKDMSSMGVNLRPHLSMIALTILATLAGADNLRAQRRFGLPVPIDRPEVVSRQTGDSVAEPAISLTSLTAPKKAKKAFESAWEEFFGQKPNYGKVIGALEQA